MLLAVASTHALAGNSKNKNIKSKELTLWRQIDENTLRSRRENLTNDGNHCVFQVNQTALKELLAEAPLEFTAAAAQKNVVLEVPMQDGTIVRFRIEESPMLAPAIAAQFPTWKTFSGQGVEDSTMTARFDINANGFHGYVMTANGTFLIDPYSLTDRKNYIVYYKGNLTEGNAGFSCNVKENKEKGIEFFSSFAPGRLATVRGSETFVSPLPQPKNTRIFSAARRLML